MREISLTAAVIVLGSFLIVAGSFLPWATFDILLTVVSKNGIELSYGLLTIPLGLGIGSVAVHAVINGGTSRYGRVTALLALAVLATVVIALVDVRFRGDETWFVWMVFLDYDPGAFLVGLGAALAAIAAWRLRAASTT